MSARHERLFIEGPAGRLEAIHQPADRVPDAPAVVICHPHPLHGGTMRNKVVYWMARAFEEAGCHVLRFNFRGVERSEGAWAEGAGEIEDAAAALDWLRARHPGAPLWMAGFSFGCYAGLAAANDAPDVAWMFAVAPAVHLYDFSFLDADPRPLTIVQGDADEIVPVDAVRTWAEKHPHARLHLIRGAGHFFPGQMEAMTRALLADVGGG
ncbi:MAG: alpha/beta fold hydrolase [Mariprofundaceae bacterium]